MSTTIRQNHVQKLKFNSGGFKDVFFFCKNVSSRYFAVLGRNAISLIKNSKYGNLKTYKSLRLQNFEIKYLSFCPKLSANFIIDAIIIE